MPDALLLTAALMGLAGGPHCAAMCGPACGAVATGRAGLLQFQAGRVAGYACLGALAAQSLQGLAWLASAVAVARPLWILLHLATLLLGLTLLWRARQPAWLEQFGLAAWQRVRARVAGLSAGGAAAVRFAGRPALSAPAAAAPPRRLPPWAAGVLWAAMPCGLLYSALALAALSGSAPAGALVMAAFAAASALSLALGPWLWRRWRRRLPGSAGTRLAGAALVAVSLWALWLGATAHGLAAWCSLP